MRRDITTILRLPILDLALVMGTATGGIIDEILSFRKASQQASLSGIHLSE
jgi:hypothetical protein